MSEDKLPVDEQIEYLKEIRATLRQIQQLESPGNTLILFRSDDWQAIKQRIDGSIRLASELIQATGRV